MQSKTSFSKGYWNTQLFCSNLSRCWPLWAVYLCVWLIMGPAMEFLQLNGGAARWYDTAQERIANAQLSLLGTTEVGLVLAVGFGCLFAMALFSYLMNPRTTGMLHSFPIRREGLFFTNYCTGVAVIACTLLLVGGLTAAVMGAAGALNLTLLVQWATVNFCEQLFFYSFAVFCAMFTGQILALPVFYVILNGLAAGLVTLLQSIGDAFYYGYEMGGYPVWIRWLTPAWKLGQSVGVDYIWREELLADGTATSFRDSISLTGVGTAAIYAFVGLLLAALALAVYCRRRSETAGDIIAPRPMKPVFRYGVGVCFALSFGQLLYYILWANFWSYGDQQSIVMLTVCMALLGLVGYFAAEMLLQKSLRVFRSGWKGGLVLAAGLILLGAGIHLDVAGVETRVPTAEQTGSVSFSISGHRAFQNTTEDTVLIEQLRGIHTAILAERDMNQTLKAQYEEDTNTSIQTSNLSLTYHLKNGTSLERRYYLYYTDEMLADSESAVGRLAAFVTEPAVQRQSIFGNFTDENGELARVTGGDLERITDFEDNRYTGDMTSLDAATAQVLVDAIQKDIDAGNFGVSSFSSTNVDVYVNTLYLYFTWPEQEEQKHEPMLYLQFSSACTNLLAALQETGVVDAGHPLTVELFDEERGYYYENFTVEYAATAVIGGADGPTAIAVG